MSGGVAPTSASSILPTTSENVGTAAVNVTWGNGVKGAWVQMIAATARPVLAILFSVDSTNANPGFYDIGVGGAGSEVVVVGNVPHLTGVAAPADTYIPIAIAAGSRIAVRSQSNVAAAAQGVICVFME